MKLIKTDPCWKLVKKYWNNCRSAESDPKLMSSIWDWVYGFSKKTWNNFNPSESDPCLSESSDRDRVLTEPRSTQNVTETRSAKLGFLQNLTLGCPSHTTRDRVLTEPRSTRNGIETRSAKLNEFFCICVCPRLSAISMKEKSFSHISCSS